MIDIKRADLRQFEHPAAFILVRNLDLAPVQKFEDSVNFKDSILLEVSSKFRQLLKGVSRSIIVQKDSIKYFYFDHTKTDEGFLTEVNVMQGQVDLYLSKGEEARPTSDSH